MSLVLYNVFCLRDLDHISVTYNHMSLTYPPGVALHAQLVLPELGQVYGAKEFSGESFQSRPSLYPSDSAGTVVSDSSPQEPLPWGPGEPTWISYPPRSEKPSTVVSLCQQPN